MDVYFVNCFLACTLSFLMGRWYAERQFKRMIAHMVQGKMGAAIIAPNSTDNDK